MKLASHLTRFALLALVIVSIGAWSMRTFSSPHEAGGGEALPADGIVVVNFHAAKRCKSCREIGTEAKAVVETDFGDDLKNGRMNWRVINYEEPANKHFIQDYGLTSSTVVVVRREAGHDAEWQRLDGVWDYEGPAMRTYLKDHIQELALP